MVEENNIKTKKDNKKAKVVACAIITIIIALAGLNAFATFNGYGNIFFIIKNLVTTGTISGEEEIFSDKEITLSYQSIDVADGVKMQINKLEILENKSNLYLTVKVSKSDVLPFKYSLKSEGLSEVKLNGKDEKGENFEYQEKLTVNYQFSSDELMTLYVKDKNEKLLREIEINLGTREIIVTGEDSNVSKISQIELKKYLGLYSALNTDLLDGDKLLFIATDARNGIIAESLQEDETMQDPYFLDRELTNKTIKEFFGEKAVFETAKNSEGKDVEVLRLGKKYSIGWEYNKIADDYTPLSKYNKEEGRYVAVMQDFKHGICLEIKDISYANDIYTIDYIYTLATDNDIEKEQIEELAQYETTIKLKRNEDAELLKYLVIEIEKGKLVKDQVATEEIVSEHKHDYRIVEASNGENHHTTLDGTHPLRCIYCNDEKQEKHRFDDGWYDIGIAWTLWCKDCKRYVYTTDENLVKNSGYPIKEQHKHTYKVVETSIGDFHTTLDGVHTVKCACGDEKQEKHNFDEWYDIGNAWTLWCKDCKRYIYTTDENFVKNSGYPIKDEHKHDFQVVKNPGNDFHADLGGEHTVRCSVCGEERKEKHNFGKWYDIGQGAWTLWCTDCGRYVYTQDENVVKNSGYEINP